MYRNDIWKWNTGNLGLETRVWWSFVNWYIFYHYRYVYFSMGLARKDFRVPSVAPTSLLLFTARRCNVLKQLILSGKIYHYMIIYNWFLWSSIWYEICIANMLQKCFQNSVNEKHLHRNTFSTYWNVTTAHIILKYNDDIDTLCPTTCNSSPKWIFYRDQDICASFENKDIGKIWFPKLTIQHVFQSVCFNKVML